MKRRKSLPIKINDIDYVICKLCKRKLKAITNGHLKWKHGITPAEYKEKFPGHLYCKKVRDERSRVRKENPILDYPGAREKHRIGISGKNNYFYGKGYKIWLKKT